MYARKFKQQELTFDFAEGLVNNNLLFVDRETHSIWSQLDGKAISGKLKNAPLITVPCLQTTWKFWRDKHPDTRVMVVEGTKGRPYFYRNWQPGKAPRRISKKHDTTNLGLGFKMGDRAFFFPFSELKKASMPMRYKIGDQTVVIHYQEQAMTAWAEDLQGHPLPAVLAYKQGWLSFNPKSVVFKAR